MVDPTDTVTAFHVGAEWTGIRDSDRTSWLAARRNMLTASDVSKIMGENRHADALAVFVEKTAEPRVDERLPLKDRRRLGQILEQPLLVAAAEEYGWEYRKGGALLRNRRRPFLGATLDAEIDRHDGHGWIDFEGKTTVITRAWDEETQTLPTEVVIQVETQMAVIEQSRALVLAFLQGYGEPLCMIELESIPELRELILEKCEWFWGCVQRLEPPPVTALSADALTRLYPEDNGQRIILPEQATRVGALLEKINARLKDLDVRKKLLKNRIREMLGDAHIGELLAPTPKGTRFFKYASESRSAYSIHVPAFEGRVLRPLKREPATKTETRTTTFRERPTPANELEVKLAESLDPAAPIVMKGRRR